MSSYLRAIQIAFEFDPDTPVGIICDRIEEEGILEACSLNRIRKLATMWDLWKELYCWHLFEGMGIPPHLAGKFCIDPPHYSSLMASSFVSIPSNPRIVLESIS